MQLLNIEALNKTLSKLTKMQQISIVVFVGNSRDIAQLGRDPKLLLLNSIKTQLSVDQHNYLEIKKINSNNREGLGPPLQDKEQQAICTKQPKNKILLRRVTSFVILILTPTAGQTVVVSIIRTAKRKKFNKLIVRNVTSSERLFG